MTITTTTSAVLAAVSTSINFMQKEGDFAGMITISGNKGNLEIKSSNIEQTVAYKNISFVSSDLTETSFQPFSINGKKIYTVLKAAKSEEVQIELLQDLIVVKSGRSKVKIETLAETQVIAIKEGGNAFDIASQIGHLEQVLHSVDTNNPRYEINGVLMQIKGGTLNVVGTDTRRLCVISSKTSSEDLEIILPKKAVETITKLFKGFDVSARIDGDSLTIFTEYLTYSTRLTSGQYPEWQRIVPRETSHKVQIKTSLLESLVQEASIFEQDIIFNIANDKIKVSDFDGSTQVEDDFQSDCEIRFAVKAHAVLDFIKSTTEENIGIHFNDLDAPFLLVANASHKEVVMPVVLAEEEVIVEGAKDAA